MLPSRTAVSFAAMISILQHGRQLLVVDAELGGPCGAVTRIYKTLTLEEPERDEPG
jgi:hypothetical protein